MSSIEYKNHFGQLALMIGCLFCIGGLFGMELSYIYYIFILNDY